MIDDEFEKRIDKLNKFYNNKLHDEKEINLNKYIKRIRSNNILRFFYRVKRLINTIKREW